MSFYSSVIDTCSIIATNSNRVKSLLLDNEEDMFDNTSLANSLAFDVAALLETTTRGLEEMCKVTISPPTESHCLMENGFFCHIPSNVLV
jgi:hypothetical protein